MKEFCFPKNPAELSSLYSSVSFDKAYSYPGELGAVYTPQETRFRIWSPTAEAVWLCLYRAGAGDNLIWKCALERAERGVWKLTLPGNFDGIYYVYEVTNFGATLETADPYARAAGVNGGRSMVVDLSGTNPKGWEQDSFARPVHPTDAIVWEVHVGDFSSDPKCGVRREWRGKYLAFTEQDTTLPDGKTPTCLSYLKKLGVTHVQLMPVYDFGSIDESEPGKAFNWGYDPLNYNVPEGSYSCNPYDGKTRIVELKRMVQALHQAGIGVVMDVVYNHTFESTESWFHRTVPYYYHRTTPDGRFADGSACGNEIASERCMCRKYIVESVLYWASEYHIDGFRFDLMGLLDVKTINRIREGLDALPDGRRILMYGEPWYASAPSLPEGVLPADKSHVKLLDPRIGVFSDFTRDAIRGDVFRRHKKGFVQGDFRFTNVIMDSLRGWTDTNREKSFASTPAQTISYVSAHDNLTLWDKLIASTKRGSAYSAYDGEIVALNKLCAVLYFMAQGMPFFQSGEEFARTKRGMENSFRAPAYRNRLDWSRSVLFADLLSYYRGLIQIRKMFPALRDPFGTSAKEIRFSRCETGTVAFALRSSADTIAVCINALPKPVEIVLEWEQTAAWDVLADGSKAGTISLRTICGNIIPVGEKSAMILRLQNSGGISPMLPGIAL